MQTQYYALSNARVLSIKMIITLPTAIIIQQYLLTLLAIDTEANGRMPAVTSGSGHGDIARSEGAHIKIVDADEVVKDMR